MVSKFPNLFSNKTGKEQPNKNQCSPKSNINCSTSTEDTSTLCRQTRDEIDKMLQEDIIEGPLEIEEPGTYLSNLVITDKKWNPKRIRVNLYCQQVNKDIFQMHEPTPTTEELRHTLKGSDRFSIIDITNCYHQFQIEPSARKLFTLTQMDGDGDGNEPCQ